MTEKRFIEQFEENVQKYPDKVILRDEHNSLTFRELDELSGRVYAYLKEKGIGREDFVMISLPRGVEVVAAMMGVWKAGAALVLTEDFLPQERKNYIYINSNGAICIDKQNWGNILAAPSISSYKHTDIHDAALVVYTSGSTGEPIGINHEYGKLDMLIDSLGCNLELLLTGNEVFGSSLPCSATAIIMLTIIFIARRIPICILPLRLDIPQLSSLYDKYHITIAGIVPTMLQNADIQTINCVITGSEMSSGLYSDQYHILNLYGQSESALIPCAFIIDHKYENTPIGKPTGITKLYLLDDKDQPVALGEAGELCYENPYTRGYINLPEETARAFRNGLYHTGDIARINEDGNYVILGRKSDMIKINGNRIEPAEIEAAVKRVLNIDWAFAKGFVEPERSFIVVYYTVNIEIDYASVREQLLKVLPTYMIPSYFVHLDEVPHLPNGKVDRQALKAPDIEQYRAEYVAPENELEERLCREMEKVLNAERFSALDDFYLLGGDSLRTIELVTNLGIENLTVTDIYMARSPRAIANRWMHKMIEE